ncbi:MAG: glycosyltransferase family 2 protein [Fibrobacterota bacterium]
MNAFFSEYIDFLTGLNFYRFTRIFWFFIIFDFSRYILLEVVLILLISLKKLIVKDRRRESFIALYRERPLISVIVPGKNEGKHIPALVRSLGKQNYKNYELIVVDDGSDDNTAEICRDLEKRGFIRHFFRNEVRGGKASAANLALRYSRGKYVVHLDADSNIEYNALEELVLPFYEDAKIGAVGGDVRVDNRFESLPTSLQALEYGKTISVGRQITSHLGMLRIISGAFGAFRMDILRRLKGWDIGPGLDGDITLKIRKMGYRVTFAQRSVCYTHVPTSFFALAKQRYRWNRSTVRFRLRKHFDLLQPTANFTILNALTVMDNLWFNLILNFNWWIYLFQITTEYTESAVYIFITNYILYIGSNILQYIFVLLLSPNRYTFREDLKLFPFLPAMPLYTGWYLRTVRTYAYLMELLFKTSYEDRWNPWKVSRQARDNNM